MMTTRKSIEFRGAYTALITPFDDDGGAVDIKRLRQAIERQAIAGVTGIVPCGTTGETPTLSEKEYREVVSTAIEEGSARNLQVIPGAGSNSTAHAVELHTWCAAAGADAALHVTPYYNKPSQEGLYRHFMTIADAADLPIIVYHIPGRTGVRIAMETLERLAEHPNIQSVKEATGSVDSAAETAERTGLAVLSGDDPLTLAILAMGGTGAVSVLSNIRPGAVAGMIRQMLAGNTGEARRIAQATAPFARGLLSLDVNPVPIKAAMALEGLDTGAVRLPLAPASEATRRALGALLDACDAALGGKPKSGAGETDQKGGGRTDVMSQAPARGGMA